MSIPDRSVAQPSSRRHAAGRSRREFLRAAVVGAVTVHGMRPLRLLAEDPGEGPGAGLPADLRAVEDRSATAPTSPVALSRCRDYERTSLASSLETLFENLGGLETIVRGKTVTMKLNITGNGRQKMVRLPAERTYQTHPVMVEVLCGLFRRAGARRIVLVESYYRGRPPEEILGSHGWDAGKIKSAADHELRFVDTRNRGEYRDYATLDVPYGGYVFPRYMVSRHYVDTDVLVSLAKLKNHVTAGITCAVKNLFGMAPTSLYGNDAPNEETTSNRGAILHYASRNPPAGMPAELHPLAAEIAANPPRVAFYRVPRVTSDLFAARPVDLAIVDAVETVKGAEGPWCPRPHKHMTPGLIIAGRNGVTTDAVCAGVMGYDPRAGYERHPFPGENHLNLLARGGVGTNDLGRIEIRGVPLREALYEFHPEKGEPGWIRQNLLGG